MKKDDIRYQTYVRILKEELIPAMGCTEPIAIAYAAAKAAEVLGAVPDKVKIEVSPNIIKNVKSVVVPDTGGMKGIASAAAAGIIGGHSEKMLEVISDISEEEKAEIRRFLDVTDIQIEPAENGLVFDIIIRLFKDTHSSMVRITQYHTNIVRIDHDGRTIFDTEKGSSAGNTEAGLADKTLLNVHDIIDFADTVDSANIGSVTLKMNGEDVKYRAIAKAAAGSDARMSGCELPVIINSGSGNQGITVSLPVIEYAHELKVSEEQLYRALCVSNLIAIHEKSGIGRLSAYCGAVSAGCAAGAAIAYLNGDGEIAINHTLVNSLVIVSGIICDGAKPSCAAKIASSVQAGIFGYEMWKNGQEFKYGDGIVNNNVESTIRNVARLGRDGMAQTDKEIVRIMLEE